MLCRIIAPAVAESKTAISRTAKNIDKNIRKFVNSVKRSEQAIIIAIKELKREFFIGIFGGSNGGAAGGI